MESEHMDKPIKYGGFWIRFVAYFIDGVINNIIGIIIGFILGLTAGFGMAATDTVADPANMALLRLSSFFLSLIATWLYFALFHSSKYQATPGKMLFGLIVTDSNYQRISFWHATGRFFATILSTITLFIGFMIAGWNSKKRALHDYVAKTYVIYK